MARHLMLSLTLTAAVATAQEMPTYAFRGADVLTMEGEGILVDQTVIVANGRIEAIGPENQLPIPSGATVIEAQGRTLLPGLAEMHAHVPGPGDEQYLRDVLFLYVANGVTTARGMLGQPAHLTLRQQLADHSILGPRLITSGPPLSGESVDSPATARGMVTEQASAGYDFIKLHPRLTRAEFDAAVEAAADAGIQLAGHVSTDVGLGRTLEAGQATVDHLDGYIDYLLRDAVEPGARQPGFFGINLVDDIDEGKIDEVARATREAGVWVVPTQSLIEHFALSTPSHEELAARSEMAYVSPGMVRQWMHSKQRVLGAEGYTPAAARRLVEIRQRLIKALHEEGAGLLLGSDAPQVFNVPGFALHHELRAMVDSGLSPYEALEMGTVNPARFFRAENEFGRVSPGLAADLILVEGNPLEDIAVVSRPLGVMVRGRWLDRAALDRGLEAIAARHR